VIPRAAFHSTDMSLSANITGNDGRLKFGFFSGFRIPINVFMAGLPQEPMNTRYPYQERSIWFFGLEHFFTQDVSEFFLRGIIGLIFVSIQYRIEIIWSVILLLP